MDSFQAGSGNSNIFIFPITEYLFYQTADPRISFLQ